MHGRKHLVAADQNGYFASLDRFAAKPAKNDLDVFAPRAYGATNLEHASRTATMYQQYMKSSGPNEIQATVFQFTTSSFRDRNYFQITFGTATLLRVKDFP